MTGETDRSKAEFLRTQRHEAYANLIANETQLSYAEYRFKILFGGLDRRYTPTSDQYYDFRKSEDQYLVKLLEGVGNVEVVGAPQAVAAAETMMNIHGDRNRAIVFLQLHTLRRQQLTSAILEEVNQAARKREDE